jgi:hypothetical protein
MAFTPILAFDRTLFFIWATPGRLITASNSARQLTPYGAAAAI